MEEPSQKIGALVTSFECGHAANGSLVMLALGQEGATETQRLFIPFQSMPELMIFLQQANEAAAKARTEHLGGDYSSKIYEQSALTVSQHRIGLAWNMRTQEHDVLLSLQAGPLALNVATTAAKAADLADSIHEAAQLARTKTRPTRN